MKIKNAVLFGFVLLLFSEQYSFAKAYEVVSPDNNIKVTVDVGGQIKWSVIYKGAQLISPSAISLNADNTILGANAVVKNTQTAKINEVFDAVVALKTKTIQNLCNELTINFKNNFSIVFRAYNDGVAYRFETKLLRDITIINEEARVSFAGDYKIYFPKEVSLMSHYERDYIYTHIDSLKESDFCSLPALVDAGNNVKIAMTETDLHDYPCMFFYGTGANELTGKFPKVVLETKPEKYPGNQKITKEADYIALTKGTRTFPWRVFIITDNDAKIVESQMVYKLASPLALKETGWIKPGKVAWDWWNALNIYGVDFKSGINTKTYKYYIDFAAKYGLEYLLMDEGWSKSNTEILEANPDIDLPELIRYAKSKNVDVVLWVLWGPLDKNYEQVLKTYSEWGVKGVKVDFLQRADQYMVNYVEKITKEAAKNKLLADFHGTFKPVGLNRTYPNFIGNEGVKGLENDKWSESITPKHNVTLPFTRMVAGPMDYTPGSMLNSEKGNFRAIWGKPMSQGTRCHQIAMYVVYESPLQMLADCPSNYLKEAECTEFISKIPTVWDDTKVLDAKVSEYIVIAREKDDKWYIGAMTDWTLREFNIDLSFLNDGNYKIEILKDGVNADKYAADYTKEIRQVNKNSKLKINLAPGGGWAAIIVKQ